MYANYSQMIRKKIFKYMYHIYTHTYNYTANVAKCKKLMSLYKGYTRILYYYYNFSANLKLFQNKVSRKEKVYLCTSFVQ